MTDRRLEAAWAALMRHRKQAQARPMRALFKTDSNRAKRFTLVLGDMLLDYSKNRVAPRTMALLFDLARAAGVEAWRDRMFAGARINATEDRAALLDAVDRRERPGHAADEVTQQRFFPPNINYHARPDGVNRADRIGAGAFGGLGHLANIIHIGREFCQNFRVFF